MTDSKDPQDLQDDWEDAELLEEVGDPAGGGLGSPEQPATELSELDFEPDALLDSLLVDPFPSSTSNPTPKAAKGARLSEPHAARVLPPPAELPRAYPEDEVTAIGQGLEELLAQTLSDSVRPAPPAPKRPLPPRPAGASAVPRPRSVTGGLPPARAPEALPTPVVPRPSLERDFRDYQQLEELEHFEDEVTRILQPTLAGPTAPPPPDADAAEMLNLMSAESFSPPAVPREEDEEEEESQVRVPPPRDLVSAPEKDASVPTGPVGNAPGRISHRPLANRLPSGVGAKADPTDPLAREAWLARAQGLEAEAQASTDPEAKARALLVASELWAIVGDTSRAREAATEAAAVGPRMVMAGRQLRWLSALEGDWQSVATALELEAKAATTEDGRVHAAYLCAEVHRLRLEDAKTASKKSDLCLNARNEDPRAHLMRLLEQLGASSAPPKLRLPEAPELAPLASAIEDLVRLRGSSQASAGTPLAFFDEARRALAVGDRGKAAVASLGLSQVEGLEEGALWLAAALFAPEAETRKNSIGLLEQLVEKSQQPSARRALAARALEEADAEALSRVLADKNAAFGVADRVTLAALSGGSLDDFDEQLRELEKEPSKRALASGAAFSAPETSRIEPSAGRPAAKRAVELGRLLARPPSAHRTRLGWLSKGVEALRAESPGRALPRTLLLEIARAERDAEGVSQRIGDLHRAELDSVSLRDRELASAFVQELAGENAGARSAYERALSAYPGSELATRALLSAADTAAQVELLERLADAEGVGMTAALHFVEAALRLGTLDRAAYDALLEKAVQADPKLMLPYLLGEQLARTSGDSQRLLFWLRLRRGVVADSLELALDLVREALLIAETDAEAASRLLKQALEARPHDVALAELYERLTPTRDASLAGWREVAASRATGRSRSRLCLEAAIEHERSGNPEAAVRAARAGLGPDAGDLMRVLFERLASRTSLSAELAEELISRVKRSEDVKEQRELYEWLSELDRGRGDASSGLLWQTAILEHSPRDSKALLRLERAYLQTRRFSELEHVEAQLAESLPGLDALPAARLAARLKIASGAWNEVRRLAELTLDQEPHSIWALRQLSAHARVSNDTAVTLSVERRLHEGAIRPLDKATLALRAGEAAARLGRWEDAQTLLEQALDAVPDHLVALTAFAEVLETRQDYTGAARALEAVAEASRVDAHRVSALYQAAVLWLDRVEDSERARIALEQAVSLDLGHDEAVIRLQSLYVASGDRQKLAELLARRLERTTDPEERIAIEVTRARALAEIGEPGAARAALSAALDANPDHSEALEAFAEVCLAEGDWTAAEQAFLRLARHPGEPDRQAQIYRRLGELYDTALPNAERAELAYLEVLKRTPDDDESVDRLVSVYARMGNAEKAVQAQTQLLERAQTPERRRDCVIRLAIVLEQVAKTPKQAELVLDKARKEWPHDASVLRALVGLEQRSGDLRTAQVLLDRATADARRALGTGRFEPILFETLATIAELRGATDAAQVAEATLAALNGRDVGVPGAGPAAASSTLDDLLAPDLLTPSFRSLLEQLGDVLDLAYPVDPRALRAGPLPHESASFLAYVQDVGRAFGFPSLQVSVSATLGLICLPASSSPPAIVFGQALLESSDDAARYCLLARALKVLQARAATLARTAPIDLWPIVAGLVSLLSPGFAPQAVDARKLAEAKTRISAVLPARNAPELGALALEVTAQIGTRASQLGTAVGQWGNRTALLAVGGPHAVLRAIAFAANVPNGPPASGPERVKWIVRNAEARDVAIFSVSENFSEARRRLKLA